MIPAERNEERATRTRNLYIEWLSLITNSDREKWSSLSDDLLALNFKRKVEEHGDKLTEN